MTIKTDIRTQRARLVKLIHVARRELDMDEDTYRLMLQNVGGADSTMRMELGKLKAVVDHLKAKGFKVRAKAQPATTSRRDRRLDSSPSARKVRALWLMLHQLGAVRDPSEQALAVYCKRIAKVDDLHWANDQQMHDLVETLKKWALRFLPAAIAELGRQLSQLTDPARMPAALRAIDYAQACLVRGRGFDFHWWAWEALAEALNQPLAADLVAAAPDGQARPPHPAEALSQ